MPAVSYKWFLGLSQFSAARCFLFTFWLKLLYSWSLMIIGNRFAKFQTTENLCMIPSFLHDWQVWCARIRDAQDAKRVERYRQVHVYKSDKTFYNTLWFCLLNSLKSLQNILKSPQITPKVPKKLHLGHIFLLGLAKTVFFTVPLPSPNWGNPPYFKWPFGRCFSLQKWRKKTYQ